MELGGAAIQMTDAPAYRGGSQAVTRVRSCQQKGRGHGGRKG